MKKIVGSVLFLFFTIVVAILTANLLYYQHQKSIPPQPPSQINAPQITTPQSSPQMQQPSPTPMPAPSTQPQPSPTPQQQPSPLPSPTPQPQVSPSPQLRTTETNSEGAKNILLEEYPDAIEIQIKHKGYDTKIEQDGEEYMIKMDRYGNIQKIEPTLSYQPTNKSAELTSAQIRTEVETRFPNAEILSIKHKGFDADFKRQDQAYRAKMDSYGNILLVEEKN